MKNEDLGQLGYSSQSDKSFGNTLKDWGKKIWYFLMDVGYGLANILGQGETANRLVNGFTSSIGLEKKDLTTADLYRLIRKAIGDQPAAYNKAISQLDSVLVKLEGKYGSLPPGLSQSLKKGSQKRRKELTSAKADLYKERAKLTTDLNKVENTLNQSLSQAANQDMIAHSRKQANQQQIGELLTSAPRLDTDTVERKLNNV